MEPVTMPADRPGPLTPPSGARAVRLADMPAARHRRLLRHPRADHMSTETETEQPAAGSLARLIAGPFVTHGFDGTEQELDVLTEVWRDLAGRDMLRTATRPAVGGTWSEPTWQPAEQPAGQPAGVALTIVGDPTPQGSKRAFMNPRTGRAVMTESAGAKLTSWRTAVADAATRAAEGLPGPLDGPLGLTVTFRLAMPASRPKRQRVLGWAWRSTAPDVDKLARSLFDGLKVGGLIRDDARIAHLDAGKVDVSTSWLGAAVTVRQLP
jgi:Holliday junction resolvase RusA-like endonuclease